MILSKKKKVPLKLKKKPSLYESENSDEGGTSSWMMTDPGEMKSAAEAARIGAGGRPPEFYMKDGEEKRIRLLSDQPIASFRRYRFRLNGKWVNATAPNGASGDDLYADAGLKSQLVFVWEIIDYEGYKDKKGKLHKNLRRYWVVSSRLFTQLERLRGKRGDLSKYDISVTRMGEGTDTQYMLTPESAEPIDESVKEDIQAQPKLRSEIEKHYAPLSDKEQRSQLKAAGLL